MDDPSPAERATIPCCCGQRGCPILQKNARTVDSLERDVKQAASKGQALLVRHEAYMLDAERERTDMAACIERLEQQKLSLEIANTKTIQENRELLNQLEELNDALAESETQVKSLTATLESTQLELKRLSILAARTESLERQLADLENEQAILHEKVAHTDEEKISAIHRWQQAERTIAHLQDQLDQIEREAKEERERHIEVVGRMERRRAVERELETAAGRLKGAAAMKTTGEKNGTNVVSHFVKDILQDNANLQLGIVELREMLTNSNEEVERLREQVVLHQPMQDESRVTTPTPTLEKELQLDKSPELHLHVHHHVQRRVKKTNRKSITPAHFQSPASHASTPSSASRASISRLTPKNIQSSTAILQHTAVTIPHSTHTNRWSMQSNQTGTSYASSVPGSPYTHSRRPSSLFDRVFSEAAYDSSRPTSPASSTFPSPEMTPTKLPPIPNEALDDPELEVPKPSKPQKKSKTPTTRNFSSPFPIRTISAPTASLAKPTVSQFSTSAEPQIANTTILEETEHEQEDGHPGAGSTSNVPITARDSSSSTDLEHESEDVLPDYFSPSYTRVRRGSSDSISVAGMDIHIAHRPSHHLLSTSAAASSSGGAMLSAHFAHAKISSARLRGQDSRALLSTMHRMPSASGSTLKSRASSTTLSQKFGGWIKGTWGNTPLTSSSNTLYPDALRSPASSASGTNSEVSSLHTTLDGGKDIARKTKEKEKEKEKEKNAAATVRARTFRMRAPGVNQAGPIWGFGPEPETPYQLTVENVDVDALGDALRE
ncbi:hypothetical protein EJ05DRAFT_510540 [Pseudovirgaria hyperparasitica]|uniref:Uncharacterized protein n=1 Tax=Pseudovirgaria hyperparasitica TaxID=470096 RepID=A0A6A6W9L4_9PEZI|nr:uncharacterized protein EJ05DRAFT_510540 [Pseudovirgaria hyperparasitica]KAF2758640.1 hypothetical protein EJ05DRAFT_510540 [Pseudovirgaria hyperparasitica]